MGVRDSNLEILLCRPIPSFFNKKKTSFDRTVLELQLHFGRCMNSWPSQTYSSSNERPPRLYHSAFTIGKFWGRLCRRHEMSATLKKNYVISAITRKFRIFPQKSLPYVRRVNVREIFISCMSVMTSGNKKKNFTDYSENV